MSDKDELAARRLEREGAVVFPTRDEAARKVQMPPEVAQAFEEAYRQIGVLEQERAHFRDSEQRLAKVLVHLVDDAGGEITLPLDDVIALQNKMLNFEVDEDEHTLTITLEDRPAPGPEAPA